MNFHLSPTEPKVIIFIDLHFVMGVHVYKDNCSVSVVKRAQLELKMMCVF